MAEYASGSIHFSGLGSDTDFSEMITKLTAIEKRHVTQLFRWKADWQTRVEAFQQVRSEMLNMQTALNAMNSVDKFLVKTTTSSKPEFATATAGADAMEGVYNLEVDKLATNSMWSQKTGIYNLKDIIAPAAAQMTFQYKNKDFVVDIPAGTTVEGLKNLINSHPKNPGIKAQFIDSSDGYVFQVRGMDTGRDASLTIMSSTVPSLSLAGLTASGYTIAPGSVTSDHTGGITPGNFIYHIDGKRYAVVVDSTVTTLQHLADKINAQNPSPLVGKAGYTPGTADDTAYVNGAGKLVISRQDDKYSIPNSGGGTALLNLLNNTGADYPSNNEIVNAGADYNITYDIERTYNGKVVGTESKTITITQNMTLQGLRTALQSQTSASGGTVNLKYDTGTTKWKLEPEFKPKEHSVSVSQDTTVAELAYAPPTDANWLVQYGQNAKFKLNGWPPGATEYLESSSNSVTNVVEGMTFNLHGEGKTTITVGIDNAAITKNVQSFVDAVNSFRTVITMLTEVSSEKTPVDPEYAKSQFEMQKGQVLTGNYGVQMIDSRINSALAMGGLGFIPWQMDSLGYYSGDVFSSLSQIGITTNAQEGSVNFGMLEVNHISGFKGSLSLEEALAKDPYAVAKLFAGNNVGAVQSSHFQYLSHIPGITKAGAYGVEYKIDSSGNLTDVKVGGQNVTVAPGSKQITVTDRNNPANGLVIEVFDFTPNSEVTLGMKESVSIQQGKVNQLLDMMNGTEGMLGSKGTLRILEDNYNAIIKGIDGKIKREDDRLIKYERTMRLKFSRLEAVLAKYNGINESLKSQIAGLNSGSKK